MTRQYLESQYRIWLGGQAAIQSFLIDKRADAYVMKGTESHAYVAACDYYPLDLHSTLFLYILIRCIVLRDMC